MSKPVFHKVDGIPQLRIQSAEDMLMIQQIHESRWMATSAPVESLNCDSIFLEYIDMDGNGRIRTDEIEKAVTWLFSVLSDVSELSEGTEQLHTREINRDHPEGKNILATIDHLAAAGRTASKETISLKDIRNEKSIYADSLANGDGIIPPPEDDAETGAFVQAIIDTLGGVKDITGKMGIGLEQLELFSRQIEEYHSWKKGEEEFSGSAEITSEAFGIFEKIADKLDEYFLACGTIRLKPEYTEMFKRIPRFGSDNDSDNYINVKKQLEFEFIAQPDPSGILPFTGPFNPLYKPLLDRFYASVPIPVVGDIEPLTEDSWSSLKKTMAAYKEWIEKKPDTKIHQLENKLLLHWIHSNLFDRCRELITEDKRLSETLNRIKDVEKLILYKRYLFPLCNNFVSMPDLVNRKKRCLFEAGSLIIAGMQLNFCLKIHNFAQHKLISGNSGMFLLYIKVLTKEDELIQKIVSPVTAGNAGTLRIGKRGIFYSTSGKVYDAEVVDILENPISLRAAVRKPFASFGKMIERQVEKISTSNYEQLEAQMASSIEGIAAPGTGSAAQGEEKKQGTGVRNLLLGGGVAIAAIGSSFAFITSTIAKVKLIHVFGVLVGIVCAILLPTMILGIFRLRKRDISFLLEASGWAINANIRLSPRICSMFTFKPKSTKLKESLRKFGKGRGIWWKVLLFFLLFGTGAAAGYLLHLFMK